MLFFVLLVAKARLSSLFLFNEKIGGVVNKQDKILSFCNIFMFSIVKKEWKQLNYELSLACSYHFIGEHPS